MIPVDSQSSAATPARNRHRIPPLRQRPV